MLCPICNLAADCVDSRQIGSDRRRRYLCHSCGKRFSTREIYDDSAFGDKRTSCQRKTTILGIDCEVRKEIFHQTFEIYTFTVPGWDECTVTGMAAARRVIGGRLDMATRNTLEIDNPMEEKGVE